MAQFIKSNGSEVELKPENGKHFSLEELQGCVGGLIEIVESNDGRLIVLNEEGKLNELPINRKASALYKYAGHDIIVGDVLICNKNQIR